jgi:hypothetical protein
MSTRNPFDRLGPTGKFPQGKLRPDDEGELAAAVYTQNGQVVINWGGKPITWLSLPPESAREFALALLRKAGTIDGVVTTVDIK